MSVSKILSKIFGNSNQRLLKKLTRVVERINAMEPHYAMMADAELKQQTAILRGRFSNGETLDALLPESFAVVREVGKRTLAMRHFDVQLIGGLVLHQGKIAEMHTGEGKTLAATLPAYLNSLTGRGVHIITVNDYLAERDAKWMGPIYEFLGLSVGVVTNALAVEARQKAYNADITYGTNNEFGFDYLRDNMAWSQEQCVQRELAYAIIDEVDSILIDEARTPLIISGTSEDSSKLYQQMNVLIPRLTRQLVEDASGDYAVDEKNKQVFLTEAGHETIENLLVQQGILAEGESLYSAQNIILMHHVIAALRAHVLFRKDVEYIVQNKQVVIVDEHTGRTMPGRRWSDGLHQAVEAKEGVPIQHENQTLASITFQNYFRLYDKLAGMTGTADTEAYEFQQIYNLAVVAIPANKLIRRNDYVDQVFLSKAEKYQVILTDVVARHKKHQPILLGTASIETSELLAALLTKHKIPHQVLNAKYHAKEAEIIAEAGRPGAVTIATNMAGRGTDIVLGGNLQAELAEHPDITAADAERLRADWQQRHDTVLEAGGLCVIGSERHEARRIDNQLRGRCGRQGDPGETVFYLSLEDDLLRIFISPGMRQMLQKLGEAGKALQSGMVARAIEGAQRRVEGHNFEIRKQLLEYDNVANEQRRVIYNERSLLMTIDDLTTIIDELIQEVVRNLVLQHMPANSLAEEWTTDELHDILQRDFNLDVAVTAWLDADQTLDTDGIIEKLLGVVHTKLRTEVADLEPQVSQRLYRSILLQTLDQHWKEHMVAMDYLRYGIGLRGYAQKDPKQEYKREAFTLFTSLLEQFKYDAVRFLLKLKVATRDEVEQLEAQRAAAAKAGADRFSYQHAVSSAIANVENVANPGTAADMLHNESKIIPYKRTTPKTSRNAECHCGSGKKYKNCHGALHDVQQ